MQGARATLEVLMNSSVILASLAVLAIVASVLGTRFHWFHFRIGLALFALSGLLGAATVAVGAWAWSHGTTSGAIAAILGALVMLPPAFGIITASGKPMIHDISTDLEDPPRFETLPVAPYDPAITSIQRKAYPEVQPIVVASSPGDALNRARAVAEENRWEIASSRPDAGILEATATTGWFGFKDDVIVRIRSAAKGSRVDVRSVSRVGKSDVGVNAKRIRAFVARF
jgi:uncharacterized protein (DUF1499 family)